jgi:stage II sporulation protein D
MRISLFSLLKPGALHVRLASGATAFVDSGRLGGSRGIGPGDQVRIRLVGDRLSILLLDAYGRIENSVSAEQVSIIPQGGATFYLVVPGKIEREVRGALSIRPPVAQARGGLQIALATDIESVVASVAAAELVGVREAEAIKALAVIARTFMLSHAGRHRDEGFDFCDTTHCQLYKGEADPVVARAASETSGEVLSFGGQPINAYFTAVCGGLSATPEMVWGGGPVNGYVYERVACAWCKESPYMKWERRAEADQVLDALSAAKGTRFSSSAEIVTEDALPGGPVRRVIILDKGRRVVMGTEEFRRAIGLHIGWNRVLSPTFQVERRGRLLVFRGRGFGSQAGLCLAGTSAQAVAGRSYRDILKFYFPGTEINRRQGKQGRSAH